jgi:hypothetical protein
MKFTKPINREVELDGQNFIVSFDDTGIEFRLKGKRKTARVAWPQVLDSARSEDGDSARTLFGLSASTATPEVEPEPVRLGQNEDAMAQTISPPAPQSQADGSAEAPPEASVPTANQSSQDRQPPADENTDRRDELGRAVTVGEGGPES